MFDLTVTSDLSRYLTYMLFHPFRPIRDSIFNNLYFSSGVLKNNIIFIYYQEVEYIRKYAPEDPNILPIQISRLSLDLEQLFTFC